MAEQVRSPLRGDVSFSRSLHEVKKYTSEGSLSEACHMGSTYWPLYQDHPQNDPKYSVNSSQCAPLAVCRKEDKVAALIWILREFVEEGQPSIVFTSTRHHVEFLHTIVQAAGLSVVCVYGTMDQVQLAFFRMNVERKAISVVYALGFFAHLKAVRPFRVFVTRKRQQINMFWGFISQSFLTQS